MEENTVQNRPLRLDDGDYSSSGLKWTKQQKIICALVFLLIVILSLGFGLGFGLSYGTLNTPDFSGSKFYSEMNDLQIMSKDGVNVYGVKDFMGNVQNMYAITAKNSTLLFENGKISMIQNGNETLLFTYNQSFYKVSYLNQTSSYELAQFSSFNVSFPQISLDDGDDDDIPIDNPFTGIVINIKDSISQSVIPQAIVNVSYYDEGRGNRSIILPNFGGGAYFLTIPKNNSGNTNISNTTSNLNMNLFSELNYNSLFVQSTKIIDNFKNSLGLQINSMLDLLGRYPINSICSSLPSASSFCSQINQDINNNIINSLSGTKTHISSIPVDPPSDLHNIKDLSAIVKIPGEIEQPISLPSTLNPFDLVSGSYGVKTQKGFCNDMTVAGADEPDSRNIDVGASSGSVKLSYQTYTVKDQIDVFYEGKNIFSTGCVGASGSINLQINGKETTINVTVTPDCAGERGTAWDYVVQCQNRQLFCKDDSCYCYPSGTPTQATPAEFDGCGSSATQSKFSYNYIYSKGEEYGFTNSCNNHDICYGTCGTNRKNCDTTFCNDMSTVCKGNTKKPKRCASWATIFCNAVKWGGQDAFFEGQQSHCHC